tara:strand:- start:4668 stop:5621 length:954 start_codon:yes stop_codon:yes gene_type:complete
MSIYKTISSKAVIRKIFRDLKPQHDTWIDDAVEWIGEALEHIGSASQLVDKQCVLDVKDHKVLMPSDLYYINQVAINNSVSPVSSNELDTLLTQVRELKTEIKEYNKTLEEEVVGQASSITNADLTTYDTQYKSNILELNKINSRIVVLEGVFFNNTNTMQPLQYGASTFHRSMHCEGCVNENTVYEDTYIIDDGYIKTSFVSGKLCLSYKAFPIDEDCFPLVPDDISFKEALFWYIYKKLLLSFVSPPETKRNGIDYGFAEQQWKYYCTQARNAANYPDIDRYESFMNQWVRLIPNLSRHDLMFEQLNMREDLYRE